MSLFDKSCRFRLSFGGTKTPSSSRQRALVGLGFHKVRSGLRILRTNTAAFSVLDLPSQIGSSGIIFRIQQPKVLRSSPRPHDKLTYHPAPLTPAPWRLKCTRFPPERAVRRNVFQRFS